MELRTERKAASRTHSLTSLVTDQSLETSGAAPPDSVFAATSTTEEVVKSLSEVLSASSDQAVTTIKGNGSNAYGEILVRISNMATDNHDKDTTHAHPHLITPVTSTQAHTPVLEAFKQRAIHNKRRAKFQSSSSSVTIPKRRRVLDWSEAAERPETVNNPILPPLEYNTPFSDAILITKQPQALPKMKNEPEYVYRGINLLLDVEGYPLPFPDQARTEIAKQQKTYAAGGIGSYAYDESFAASMVNDGRGKIGQRGFSSTGGLRTKLATAIRQQNQAPGKAAGLPFRCKDACRTMIDVIPTTDDGERKERMIDAANDLAFSPGSNGTKEMTSTDRVLGTYELLERILLKCGESQDHDTVLNVQRVNKTFEKVVKRSTRLKQMLLSERRRRGRIMA